MVLPTSAISKLRAKPTVLNAVALMGPDGLPWPTRTQLERSSTGSKAKLSVLQPLATGRTYVIVVRAAHGVWQLPLSVPKGVDVQAPW